MDAAADGGFFPQVYDELKVLAAARLAGEAPGHTLDATALVHEAYLRLGDASFADRSRFFRPAAVAMQRILVDHARRRRAAKRGSGDRTLAFTDDEPVHAADPDVILDIDEPSPGWRSRTHRPRRWPAPTFRRPVDRRGRGSHGRLASNRVPRMGLRSILAGHGPGFDAIDA